MWTAEPSVSWERRVTLLSVHNGSHWKNQSEFEYDNVMGLVLTIRLLVSEGGVRMQVPGSQRERSMQRQ